MWCFGKYVYISKWTRNGRDCPGFVLSSKKIFCPGVVGNIFDFTLAAMAPVAAFFLRSTSGLCLQLDWRTKRCTAAWVQRVTSKTLACVKYILEIKVHCICTVCMENLIFRRNDHKQGENIKKHGVSFEEARTVFFDEAAIEFYDDEHPDWEKRFLLLGLSSKLRLLIVCHCYRESDSEIRNI